MNLNRIRDHHPFPFLHRKHPQFLRQRLIRPRPQPMRARRIPHQPSARIHPRLTRGVTQRRCGIVVEVNHADGQDTHRLLAFEPFVACLARWFQKPSRHPWHLKTKHCCSSARISPRVCRWIAFTAHRIFGHVKWRKACGELGLQNSQRGCWEIWWTTASR